MGRRSKREERRRQIVGAFARVLADHGFAGATMTAVAAEADLSPGLLHHHFESKDAMLNALVDVLLDRFRSRTAFYAAQAEEERKPPLLGFVDAALALDERADIVAARCWVGVFAEAMRNPALLARLRRLIDGQVVALERLSNGRLSAQDASAVMAFVAGALVFGAFAPKKARGFAAPSLKAFVTALAKAS